MEKLRKEVEPPQKHSSGVGLMLIASAAMFFAVAGSAFILRARMASGCHMHHEPAQVRVVAPAPRPSAEPSVELRECGTGTFIDNNDGTQSVHFTLCNRHDDDTAIRGVEVQPVVR